MITFIFEPEIQEPTGGAPKVSNGSGIDKQGYIPYNIISDAVRPDTIKDAINNTHGMRVMPFNKIDFNNDDVYIYPIFTTHLLNTFGYTDEIIYKQKHKFLEPEKVVIPSIFEFLPDVIINKARKKELYIAVMSICEGKAYPCGWEHVKLSCQQYNIPESQILPILCGNHSEYSTHTNNFREDCLHLNYYALELSYKIRKGYDTVLNKLPSEKKKHFICLNSQIKPHRYHLVSNIFNNDLINYGYVSCQNYESHVNNLSQVEGIYQMKNILRNDGANMMEFVQFYNTLPYNVDSFDKDSYNNALHSSWNHNLSSYLPSVEDASKQIDAYYKSAAIDVVTETALLNHHVNFISEKTFKSIMFKMPFIISGDKGNNKELLRHGFKLYDMLFDYSFDDLDSYVDRNNNITKQLKEYCDMPLEKFADRVNRDDVQEVVQHNFELLQSNKIWNNFIDSLFLRLGVNKPI